MKSHTNLDTGDFLVMFIIALGSMAAAALGLIKLASKYVAEVVIHQEHPKHAVIHNGNLIAATACLLAFAASTAFFAFVYNKHMNRYR